jgi:hypothetical protein
MAKPAIIQLVESVGNTNLPTSTALMQYNPAEHDVFNKAKRKKRKIIVPTGEKKTVGDKEVDVTAVKYEEVNRIGIPLQKLIVNRRIAFMNTGNMNILAKPKTDQEKTLLEMVKKTREDNKMEFKLSEIAERMMSELQVAELWYSEDVESGYWGELAPNATKRMRLKIISPALGDRLLPVFNGSGSLTYFARGYKTTPDVTDKIDFNNPESTEVIAISNTEIEHLDIYNVDTILKFEQENGVWILKGTIKHTYGSVPVIFYKQDAPEWADVQPIIDRIETLLSNFADTNDANGSPILFAKGIIKSMPARGETGKMINVVPQIGKDNKEVGEADLKYVTWDRAPESVKLEFETDLNFIYTCMQTPDISTKGMAELSIQSGVGFDRVFVDAHLGAMKHTKGTFGECTQRSLNFLVKACVAINTSLKPAVNLQLKPDFPLFRINDEAETINMLTAATGGEAVLSQKTAVGLSGLTQDPEGEYAQIKKEADTLGQDITGNEPPVSPVKIKTKEQTT